MTADDALENDAVHILRAGNRLVLAWQGAWWPPCGPTLQALHATCSTFGFVRLSQTFFEAAKPSPPETDYTLAVTLNAAEGSGQIVAGPLTFRVTWSDDARALLLTDAPPGAFN